MKLSYCILTVLCSCVLNSHAGTIDIAERDEYLRNIVEDVWNQLIEYDYSNLPVEDYALAYNTTTWGHELVGDAYYEDGFVMDIESVEIDPRAISSVVSRSQITLKSTMNFRNLDIFFDVRAHFTVGHKVGTVVIKSMTYVYDLSIVQDLATMNVVGTVIRGRNVKGSYIWDYNPDDPLFARIRKHYITQPLAPSILHNAVTQWRPILQEMLTNALERYKFPKLFL